MNKPKYPTTLFKDGTDRDDTIIVADAEEVERAAKVGYFPYSAASAADAGDRQVKTKKAHK